MAQTQEEKQFKFGIIDIPDKNIFISDSDGKLEIRRKTDVKLVKQINHRFGNLLSGVYE